MKQMKNFLIIFFLFVSFFVFSKQVNALEYISSTHSITYSEAIAPNSFKDIKVTCKNIGDYSINSLKDGTILGNSSSCHDNEVFYLQDNMGVNGNNNDEDIADGSYCIDTSSGDFNPCTDGQFNILGGVIGNYVSVPIPATYSCSISDIGGCIASSLQYLFIPSDTAINDLTNLSDTIKNKPPIGYITGTLTALSGISATGIPSLSFASFTPLNTYIFTPLRAGLIWILWIVFLFLLFKRFSHFEL
jgi:hypothetical protein